MFSFLCKCLVFETFPHICSSLCGVQCCYPINRYSTDERMTVTKFDFYNLKKNVGQS